MTEITTHVLDTATGRPAGGVPVSLQREVSDGEWREIGQAITRSDGRAHGLSGQDGTGPGRYCLVFDTAIYHEEYAAFFGEVIVTFGVEPSDEELHIPLLLSPYGYTVYKGS
jgi:5-hydroxyisourate hydrolase